MKGVRGRTSKLNPREQLLSCKFYVPHNEYVLYEAVNWNCSQTIFLSDEYFTCSIVCEVMANEIAWPCKQQNARPRDRIPGLMGCINTTDRTQLRIHLPHLEERRAYYDVRRKMYSFNNLEVVDHDGSIIYILHSLAGSSHDVRCL